jgi:uncharacterized cupin superfamily protein
MADSSEEKVALSEELVWLKGTEGEVMAIRVDNRSTGGAYAVIEAVHEPDCSVPTHLHRNEEEHFLVLAGQYRIAIGDDILEARLPGSGCSVRTDHGAFSTIWVRNPRAAYGVAAELHNSTTDEGPTYANGEGVLGSRT